MDEKIPFVNLGRQIDRIKSDVLNAIERVIDDRSFILGDHVKRFEKGFMDTLGARYGSGCSDGTAALALAMEALGIGKGDEVITVPHTFVATAEAICHVGATPVFVDVDPNTYNIDVSAIEAAITPKTKALLPVHIYGMPCDMDGLTSLAEMHDLALIEDAAQAHLASYNQQYVGTFGDAGTFSFYPGKNLGAFGDAGFVIAKTEEVAERVRRLRDHGRVSKYEHQIVGYNHRMDGIQAAILSVKLTHLPHWTERRRAAAAQYSERLLGQGFQLQQVQAGAFPVYHLFTVQVANRDDVMAHLQRNGIGCGIHYPVPCHLQPAFQNLHGKCLPIAEALATRILSLPICGEITQSEVDRVCDVFLQVARP